MNKSIPLNHLNQLRAYIYKKVQNADDTHDILQEVFIKINKNISSLKDDQKIISWIYTIAHNSIMDFYRNKKRTAIYNNMWVEELEKDSVNLNEKVAMCLRSFINTLPDIYKDALTLSELEGKTQKEVSLLLGISLSGAKSRVQRGKEKLAKILKDCCDWEVDVYGNILDYSNKRVCCKPC